MGNQKRHFSTDLNKALKLGKRTHNNSYRENKIWKNCIYHNHIYTLKYYINCKKLLKI